MEDENLLTVPEAAIRAGVTQDTIRAAMSRSRLPFVEKYGRKLVKVSDLDAYRATAKVGRPKKKDTTE